MVHENENVLTCCRKEQVCLIREDLPLGAFMEKKGSQVIMFQHGKDDFRIQLIKTIQKKTFQIQCGPKPLIVLQVLRSFLLVNINTSTRTENEL